MARKRRGRSEGGIYQRESDNRWCASVSLGYDAAGKRRRKVVYGDSKAEVAEKLRAVMSQADVGQLPDGPDITLGHWLDRWLTLVAPTVEPNTLGPYRRHVERHIAPRVGRAKLTKFRPADVENLYAALLGDGVSPALVRKIGTTLTIALNHAVRSRLLPANPSAGVRKPKATKKPVVVLDGAQTGTFVAACDGTRYGPMFLLMLDAGIRPGEALALSWPDIDFDRGRVSVTKSAEEISGKIRIKDPKTKKAVRQIDITPATLAALNSHRQAMLKEGRDVREGVVFCNGRGVHTHIGTLHNHHFKPLAKRAGVPDITMYSLRHTCATLLLLANVNPKVVSERLGHSTIQLTLDTYSHVLPTMQKAAADVMARLLDPARRVSV